MANYLVTGGAGFIGSNIVEHLVEQGEGVRVLDSLLTGNKNNLASVMDRIEFIEGDIRDPETCRHATEDMDYVLHEAALPSVPRSVEEPVETSAINLMGTIQLLSACVKAKVHRVVFAASSSAYGDQPIDVKHEDLMPSPLSPYAAAKLACEYYCQTFHAAYGLETVCLRYFNIFGPRQDPKSPYSAVIPIFLTAMLEGKSPTIFGDGEQSRDFTYIENVVRANVLAAHAKPEAAGKVFNIACGESYSLLDLVKEINGLLGTKIEPIHEAPRVGDVKNSLADISRAKEFLEYGVSVDFKEGLRKTLEWYRGE